MFQIAHRTSTCAASYGVKVNPFNKTCVYTFENGRTYLFKNVARTKILNLMLNEVISLGFWVQELVNNSVQENRYNVQTGRLTYNESGFSPYRGKLINF